MGLQMGLDGAEQGVRVRAVEIDRDLAVADAVAVELAHGGDRLHDPVLEEIEFAPLELLLRQGPDVDLNQDGLLLGLARRGWLAHRGRLARGGRDRKSTRLNSSHANIS